MPWDCSSRLPASSRIAGHRAPCPAFTGIGDSGRTDVSERADELLAEGFGR